MATTCSRLSCLLTYLHILVSTPWMLARFVFDVLLFLIPQARPVREWTLKKAVRVRVVRLVLAYFSLLRSGDRLSLRPGRERNRFYAIQPPSSKLFQGPLSDALIRPRELGMTWTPARPPPAQVIGPNTTVGLHFHGGGYVIGDGRDHDTGFLARTLIKHMGCSHVCTPQYRLSSHEGVRFPATLQDGLTAYVHLLKDLGIPASQIILGGDSAGGNLALGLLRYIKEHGDELDIPPPGAVALWSPWVDVGGALHQDIKMSPNIKSDYLNGDFGRWGATTISGWGAVDPSGPYLAPLHHPFKLDASIPMFVNAGGAEVLCDDIVEFCKRYKNAGWSLDLVVSDACPHDSILLGDKMGFARESEEAADKARAFLSSTTPLRLRC